LHKLVIKDYNDYIYGSLTIFLVVFLYELFTEILLEHSHYIASQVVPK